MIEARNVSKRYAQTLAVDDLSIGVATGQVTGFLGPNGRGPATPNERIWGTRLFGEFGEVGASRIWQEGLSSSDATET
jgi:ABC-type Na+ transport system ATPase subunit NatA